MKKLYFLSLFLFFVLFASVNTALAQCSYYPVSMEQRVSQAKYIVLGKVVEKQTYVDNTTGNVNTRNKLQVNAWLKNHSDVESVFVITLGGVYGNIATQVDPSLQLDQQHEYILMLEEDNQQIDDKNLRSQHPQSLQLLTYADAQGCLVNNNNLYKDYFDKTPKNEQTVFDEISALTRQAAKKPSGELFQPRSSLIISSNRVMAITGFAPGTTRAGTIVPGDFITITGSGFGAGAGTVLFSNADDGGATYMSSGIVSDITAWSDASITVKVPPGAGTGPINVNGTMTSGSVLTIDYSHLAVNSSFSGFGSSTRQRYYHRNMNGAGGYTFVYNTTSGFSANAPAVAAFERALTSWRINTFINWQASGTAATGFGDDNVNIVMFDGTLPAGTLGRATSRFIGSNFGGCTTTNTVWCIEEMDVQFYPDPPSAGFPWEYGPAAPSFTEYDFESVAVHELGHAHGLGHVISPAAIMHYAIANGSAKRVLSATDIAAGTARISYSTSATCSNPAACGSGPMSAFVILPLHLISFSGERKGPSINKLTWITAQEQNTRGFYIQRSGDGVTFNEIDFVTAAGSSNQPLNYTFSDNTAGPHPWYYKLRMADTDGQHTFSSTIFIEGDQSTQWKVWTNEKGDKIYLYSNVAGRDDAVLKVFSANGQQVVAKKLKAGNSDEIPVTFLSRGLYHYQLLYNGKIVSGKLFLGSR
jgi:hypothetical protein